ncbi:uncharacterized protein L199_006465 [Kwoniella botswanensis]|uniref:uncharacterized protein n=1 Tax=Kwoniella botswanensis TaxID=1268659 RepID=UPI00315D6CF4
MLKPPLYCSICSSPCHLPRIPLPLPLTTSFSSCQEDIQAQSHCKLEEWLSAWYCLRVSSGLIDPTPFLFHSVEPSSLPLPPLQSGGLNEKRQNEEELPRRCIPIHSYCLSLILQTIRKTPYSNARSHEESVLLNWSLPKWTGYFPWCNLTAKEKGKSFAVPEGLTGKDGERQAMVMKPGFWGGMWDARSRFAKVGDHLVADDLISPLSIPPPTSRLLIAPFCNSYNVDRPNQPPNCKLLDLPLPILNRIVEHILDEPPIPSSVSSQNVKNQSKSKFTPFLNPQSVNTFLSFSQTCSTLDHLQIPSYVWRTLVEDSVKVYRNGLLQRWRANPTGVGSAMQLWESLEDDFDNSVNKVIQQAIKNNQNQNQDQDRYPSVEGQQGVRSGYDMKDVWLWWNYNLQWKSKRRIWKCVVHATATARDADWW